MRRGLFVLVGGSRQRGRIHGPVAKGMCASSWCELWPWKVVASQSSIHPLKANNLCQAPGKRILGRADSPAYWVYYLSAMSDKRTGVFLLIVKFSQKILNHCFPPKKIVDSDIYIMVSIVSMSRFYVSDHVNFQGC